MAEPALAGPGAGVDGAGVDAAGTPGIRLRGLRKTFGSIVAVDSIDLDVRDGEFFAVLGPSGSGKTTVLRMIAGFERPSAGTVELAGQDATSLPPFLRDVNTVFQDYALFPHMSVQRNVEYGLRVKKVGRDERARRASEALELVQLSGMADRRPENLSGGQRQRVALARALVNRPKVLLLDEPLGALDLKLREQMQVELKGIQRELGITFVFVTHDQDEALTLSDRLAVMRDGRIEQIGASQEVYESPRTRFVAEFVGTSNVVSGGIADTIFGTSATVAVRPEKLRVLPDGIGAEPGDGTVRGRVLEVVYAGPQSRIVVETSGARMTAVALSSDPYAGGVTRGDTVTLAWKPDAVRTLTD